MAKTRPLTRDELTASAERATRRLDEGIDRMDAGDPIGVEMVANALRQLVGKDAADSYALRLFAALGGDEPSLPSVTTGVPRRDPELRFALGSLPRRSDDTDTEASAPTMAELLLRRCLLIADEAEQVSYRWESLIAVLANKLGGVHRPEEIPVIVDEISRYRVGGVPVLRYALRNFGVLTSRYTHALLGRVGMAPGSVHSDVPSNVPWIGAVFIRGDLDSKLDVQVLAEMREGVLARVMGRGTKPRLALQPASA